MENEKTVMIISDLEIEFAVALSEAARGEDNARTVSDLAAWGKPVDIRTMVHRLRVAGVPICSGRRGYYYAKSLVDIKRTVANLESRVSALNKAINGLNEFVYIYHDDFSVSPEDIVRDSEY